MEKLRLYNTLTRIKEEFKPLKKGKVGLYTCGPTVYNFAHIGNLRAYLSQDVLVRTLKHYFGDRQVKWVMNITDVDDKTIRDSKKKYPKAEPLEALKKFTAEFEKIFWQDLKALNILEPDKTPHAADANYIKAMQALVGKIVKAGYGYIKDSSVYFDLVKYGKKYKYGRLVTLNIAKLKAGTRGDADEYDKENIQDFVLWKGQKPGEPFWEFKLDGVSLPGRPGWHIECSAMSQAELGCPFDIHAGGEDLKFPHHEDEIAQSVVGYKQAKPVNYWLHNGMLMIESQKMSKSLGNFYNLRDLKSKTKNILSYRFLCLLTHYRKSLDFSWTSLNAAENGLNHLANQVKELGGKKGRIDQSYKVLFIGKINDDLNTPGALAVVQKMLKDKALSDADKLATVMDFDRILGLGLAIKQSGENLPEEILALIGARVKARENNNWAESDRLRGHIEKLGFTVEDTKDGQRVSNR